MGRHYEPRVLSSVLDRLTSVAPSGEIGSVSADSIQGMQAAIGRDLRALLNTRRQEYLVPADFEQTSTSIVNFGIPDFLGYTLRSPADQSHLRKALETAIRTFEPRLTNVRVVLLGWDDVSPVLRFRVLADLKVEPAPEPVMFDTDLQGDSGKFFVRGKTQ